jgi:dihydrofolate reductase
MKNITGNRVLVNGEIKAAVQKIKSEPGKDIWLFGGADLSASLLNHGLVDEMTLAVHPLLLGRGKPLFQNIKKRINLELTASKTYPNGLMMLSYRFI